MISFNEAQAIQEYQAHIAYENIRSRTETTSVLQQATESNNVCSQLENREVGSSGLRSQTQS